MRHAAPVRCFCLPLDIEVLTHSHRSSVPPPPPAAYDGLAWRALTLRRRRGTLSGKYSDHSLYVAPSNFDGVQPGRVPKYGGQVRSAKSVRATYGCFVRSPSSGALCGSGRSLESPARARELHPCAIVEPLGVSAISRA